MTPAPLRLDIDLGALAANWRTMARASGGAACGAAVKAEGYGLGAAPVVERLAREGCRDFFVATWGEAAALGELPDGVDLAVLHGVGPDDMAAALASSARPVLVSTEQVARWREAAPERLCDVMVDTGMNRLGISVADLDAASGLAIHTLHSHLACADQPGHPLNATQLARFRDAAARLPAKRLSLANSAGIMLGSDYHFGMTRPGIALYGGLPAPGAAVTIQQVVRPFARVVQVRDIPAGGSIGYGATYTADAATRVAVINLGYADGYLRAFSGVGEAVIQGQRRAVLGRISMDLTIVDVTGASVAEGDWIGLDFDLPRAAAVTRLSQYELLTCLGDRYQRRYI